jgi:WD40 repeat protein
MKQPKFFFALIICVCFFFNGCNAQPQTNSLKLIASITLPDVSGRIDHLSFDSKHQLIFVAALGNNSVEAVHLKSKKVVHTIKNLHEPQGVIFIPESNSIFVANGDNGECIIFNAETFQKVTTIKLSGDADNVRYDAAAKKIYVGYGNGGIAIIDAATMKQINSVKLDGHPESFQLAKKQNRLYINVPEANEIEVADLTTYAIIAKWKNTNASSNFPMALDENNSHLFIACRSPATLRMINTETGKDITSVKISGDADDVFYNAADSLVFVSAGKGYIDVFKATANELEHINHVETSPGARTSLLLSSENKFLLAVPSRNGNSAALWVYDISK